MDLYSLIEAAHILDSQEGSSHRGSASDGWHSPASNSCSSTDSNTRGSPPKNRSPNYKNGVRRTESNRTFNREVHNRLEKNRRAQMKEGFEALKSLVPSICGNKISSLSLLKHATDYVKELTDEGNALRREKNSLKLHQSELLRMRDMLAPEILFTEPKTASSEPELDPIDDNMDNDESTTTASEGEESASESDKVSKMCDASSSPDPYGHGPTKSFMENASRPSVVVSMKGKQPDSPHESKEKSQILYSQLTSSVSDVKSLIKTEVPSSPPHKMHFSAEESSCFIEVAESLLQLNSFEGTAHHSETTNTGLGEPLIKSEQPELLTKKVVKKNSTADKEKSKTAVRKRKLPVPKGVPEKKVLVTDTQEGSKILPLTELVAVNQPGTKCKAEIKTVKQMSLPEDKHKYIVAFRPCSVRNSSGLTLRPTVSTNIKQVVPKLLLNSNDGKKKDGGEPSDQFILISGNQANSLTSDIKPQVMIFENELKLIRCKPFLKQESLSKNFNSDLNSVKGNVGPQENSVTTTSGEKFLLRNVKPIMNAKGIAHSSNGSVTTISDKKSQDVTFHTSVLSPLSFVVSSDNNRPYSEVQLCLPNQKLQQQDAAMQKMFPTSSQQTSNSVVNHDHLLKPSQTAFHPHPSESKLYLITVPNPNKTVQVNDDGV